MKTFIIAAQTVDGYIARDEKEKSTKWTSKEDYLHFVKKTKETGVVVMGRKTFDTIGKALKNRLNIVMTQNPKKCQKKYKKENNLIFTNDSSEKILKDLEKKGFKEIAICGGASIYNLFMKKNLVDEIILTIEPVIFGRGIKLIDNIIEKNFRLEKMTKLNKNGTIVLEYKVRK